MIQFFTTITSIILFAVSLFGQNEINIYDQTKELLDEFKLKHVSPPKRDSSLNHRIGELLLDEMDDRGFYYLKFDSTLIMETKYFDSEGLSRQLDFLLRKIYKNYHERIEYVARTFENIYSQGSKYADQGMLHFGGTKQKYKDDYPALLKKWKRYIAYNTYLKIFDNLDPEIITDKNATLKIFPTYWDMVVDEEKCSLEEYDLSYEDFCEVFLECIAKSHDPHSSYFTYMEAMDFLKSLSWTKP